MAQYKESMDRLLGAKVEGGNVENGPVSVDEIFENPIDSQGEHETYEITSSSDNSLAREISTICFIYKDDILSFLCISWVLLFVTYLTRELFFDNLHMTLLGILAAAIANCVPIGGGVVYVPALSLLGAEMKLGVAFSVATMSIGNGIFGFLKWNAKDSSLILWSTFPLTVIPCWIGSAIGILWIPSMTNAALKLFFAIFCICLAAFVLYAADQGGVDNIVDMPIENEEEHMAKSGRRARPSAPSSMFPKLYERPSFSIESISESSESWQLLLALVSFLGGLFLVPNIGIGPALTTYLLLVLMGFRTKAAMVTGVITGGWVSVVPFLLHLLVFKDVPIVLWLMVLPGVYMGAQLAPWAHERLGMSNVLYLFATFLVVTAVIFLAKL